MRLTAENMALYAVTDRRRLHGRTLAEAVWEACEGGITFLQYREKHRTPEGFRAEACVLQEIAAEFGIPFVINDNVWLAKEIGADGVHLGQSDMDPLQAREILGPEKIIGVSAHNSAEACEAERKGADYLGSGAVFATSTKENTTHLTAEEFRRIRESAQIPIVLIGGITVQNIGQLAGYGADGAAVSSAVFGAEDIRGSCRELLAAVRAWER